MKTLALAVAFTVAASVVQAAPFDRVRPVYDVLGMPDLVEILRDEGIEYSTGLQDSIFPGRGSDVWPGEVETIYRAERMEETLLESLDEQLDDADVTGITEFFDSELGQRVVTLELSARRAMLEEAVLEAAGQSWPGLEDRDPARWRLVEEFVETNDLIESNVAGAMTSQYAFLRGMVDGNAFPNPMTEQDILTDVWGQEPEIRAETTDWVFSFITMAYQPLSDEELGAYLDFSRTPAGKAMNAALFTAFNDLYADIMRDLGLAAAPLVAGRDI